MVRLSFGVLGSLEVVDAERPIALGGPKQRALLAMLLLHANEPVSRDRLVDGIWGEHPPPSSGQTLDTYVSRLRKLLGPERIERRGAGWALLVEPGELDVDRFGRLADEGRYAEALAVWRGPALADLLYEPFAQAEAERLEERRLNVLEERIDADLAAGAGPELVPELERLVGEHPLRERLLAQLMVALYRAGRQATALEVYRRATRSLAEELGLEPGPRLRELERQILAHDPHLAATPRAEAPRAEAPGRRRRGRGWVAAAAAATLAATGAALGIALGREGGSAGIPVAAGDQLVALGARAGTALPGSAAAIASDTTSLWLAEPDANTVVRADRGSGEVVGRVPLRGNPETIAVAGGSVWVGTRTSLRRIDPQTEAVVQTVDLGGADVAALAARGGDLWVADRADGALLDLDAVNGRVRRTVTLGLRPTALAIGAGAIWAADYAANTVAEVDPKSGRTLATIHVGGGPAALAAGGAAIWVANSLDSTVSRIDPETGSVVATIPVGSGPSSLAATDARVWVGNEFSQTVSRIDPARNDVVETHAAGGGPTGSPLPRAGSG